MIQVDELKIQMQIIFAKLEKVAITTDLWQAANQNFYLRITVHYIDANSVLESKVLSLRHIEVNHSADNLYNAIKGILEEWLLLDKVINSIITKLILKIY